MTSPQKRQLREYNHEVKREHDISFPEGEEHLHFDANIYEDWMETTTSPQHLQQQQQQTCEGLHAIELHTERMMTKLAFEEGRLAELHVPPRRP
jgi:hypothetical protein